MPAICYFYTLLFSYWLLRTWLPVIGSWRLSLPTAGAPVGSRSINSGNTLSSSHQLMRFVESIYGVGALESYQLPSLWTWKTLSAVAVTIDYSFNLKKILLPFVWSLDFHRIFSVRVDVSRSQERAITGGTIQGIIRRPLFTIYVNDVPKRSGAKLSILTYGKTVYVVRRANFAVLQLQLHLNA